MPKIFPAGRPAKAPAIGALVAGVFSAVLLADLVRYEQEKVLQEEVGKLARDRAEVIRSHLMRSMEVLHGLASLYDTKRDVSREEFRTFVDRALSRQPELQALAWDPRVPAADRAAWEARARADGFEGFTFTEEKSQGELVSAGQRAEYFPVYYLESFRKNAPALGFDVGSEPHRREALEEARDTGLPVATTPVRLTQEPESQQGFVVFLPIYQGPAETVEERRASLEGFATAVFRIGDLVQMSLRAAGQNGVVLTIMDSKIGETIFHQPGERLRGKPTWTTDIAFAGRNWTLLFEPETSMRRLSSAALPWAASSAGLAITLLLAAYLWSSARRSAELQASHEAMTAEISVRRQAEASAEAANSAKSNFLASMSREIRTPMNAILGYAQILARDATLPRFHRDMVATVISSGNHLLHLINEVLDLSKIDAGCMELSAADFDLASLVNELVAMFQHPCEEKQLGLRLEAPDLTRPTPVHGDEGKLRQVLINLLGNAVKFTERGRVTLRAIKGEGNEWKFEVEDTGIGIDAAARERIFEPFQQGPGDHAKAGSGLGLAISKRQVDILGGKLGVNSQPGRGSNFHVTLTLAPAGKHAAAPAGRETRALAAGHRVRALVVDDIPENRDVLATMLTMVGCEVVLAEHGRQAVEVVGVSRPQIVFMDMRMPEFGGIEATRRIVEDFGSTGVKIVATSASAMAHERESCLRAGCDDFVAKPFQAERIYGTLRNLLGVEFDYHERADAEEIGETIDLGKMSLPEDLAARMAMAAELHSATVLKSCCLEVEQLGVTGQRLAQHLRGFLSSYDMKTIQRILAQIPVIP